MSGRYRPTTQEEELARLYHIPIPKQTDLPISYNIAPSQKVLTIRFNPETRAAFALRHPVGTHFLLGQRPKDRLPDHQRPSSRPSIKRPHIGRPSPNAAA
jgi:putative SOS response-associated peptidase YedK